MSYRNHSNIQTSLLNMSLSCKFDMQQASDIFQGISRHHSRLVHGGRIQMHTPGPIRNGTSKAGLELFLGWHCIQGLDAVHVEQLVVTSSAGRAKKSTARFFSIPRRCVLG